MKQFCPPMPNSNFWFSSKVNLICFALLCGYIACRPSSEQVVDYRRDMDGMTIEELCGKFSFCWVHVKFTFLSMKSSCVAQYPNGATFPKLFLSCMRGRTFDVDLEDSLVSKRLSIFRQMIIYSLFPSKGRA